MPTYWAGLLLLPATALLFHAADWHTMSREINPPRKQRKGAKRKAVDADSDYSPDGEQQDSRKSIKKTPAPEKVKLSPADLALSLEVAESDSHEDNDRPTKRATESQHEDESHLGEDGSSSTNQPIPKKRKKRKSSHQTEVTETPPPARPPSPAAEDSPLSTPEVNAAEPSTIEGLIMANESLQRKIERRNKKIERLQRRIVELEAAQARHDQGQILERRNSAQSLNQNGRAASPPEIVQSKVRKMDYPLPTGDYVLPEHVVSRSPSSNAKDFAKFTMKKVFTREERATHSLYGGRVASNEYRTKPALDAHKMNAILRAASNGLDEDPELSLNSVDLGLQQQLHHEQHQQHDVLDIGDELQSEGGPVQRRFECPAGFFRLRRNCYYLSGGTAQWREAHFQCTARNSTLAVLSRSGKDKILRKYLMGDQFRRLERWIGGIYNWRQMNWEWGVSGEKVLFENFGKVDQPPSANFMSCIVLDPTQEYKWNSRSCVEQKYFICEVPAGRIGKSRRRKNISDPLAPQNQRLRPSKNDRKHKMNRSKKGKLRSMRKNEWYLHDDNQIWIHGIKPGSRAPKGSSRRNSTKRQRAMQKKGEAAGRQRAQKKQQRKHQIASSTESQELQPTTPGPKDSNSFSNNDIRRMQHLSDDEVIFPRLSVNDFAREEILLKL